MIHQISKPQFAYNALEPYIDAQTMEIHTEKHHQTYADKLNAALANEPSLQSLSLEELLTPSDQATKLPSYQTILNTAGGVWNHNFFWSILAAPSENRETPSWFTSNLKADFTEAATKLFGSGWVWIVKSDDPATQLSNNLAVISTPNQDTPLALGKTPLLALDLWEHAYYLKYQNRRAEYIDAFWHIINWDKVQALYEEL